MNSLMTSREHISIDYSFSHRLKYPFDSSEISPVYNDPYDRPLERLLASFSKFGKELLNRNFPDMNVDLHHFQSVLRMCDDCMLPEDFAVFANRLPISKMSRIVSPGQELTSTLKDARTLQQIIVAHFTTPIHWLVVLVSLNTGHVDIYSYGDVAIESIEQFAGQVHQSLRNVFQGKKFKFRMRLAFPTGFIKDPVLSAFLLSFYLHIHGKYLNMTELDVMRHKFTFLNEFIEYHDKWLGAASLGTISTKAYPFFVHYGGSDNLELLQKKGWEVIDVDGDGNCGYYSFALGLESHGINTYKPTQESRATSMSRNLPWKSSIIQLRKDMRERSDRLLNENCTLVPQMSLNGGCKLHHQSMKKRCSMPLQKPMKLILRKTRKLLIVFNHIHVLSRFRIVATLPTSQIISLVDLTLATKWIVCGAPLSSRLCSTSALSAFVEKYIKFRMN
jgi:hypothetical protein